MDIYDPGTAAGSHGFRYYGYDQVIVKYVGVNSCMTMTCIHNEGLWGAHFAFSTADKKEITKEFVGNTLGYLEEGMPSTKAGTVLFLEGDDGKADTVRSDRLIEALKVLKNPPSLCFLAACETAARARTDAFLPLGPALVEDGGIQAAVAMTERVGLRTAQQFSAQFYARLLTHGVIDLAVNEARALVQDEWDWGAPVLFSRLPDNQLIDFPVGRFSHNYLSHTNRAFSMAGEALAAARRDNSQQVVGDLERLIK